MSERPWYKRYGGDFVMGTMSLSLEEKGAYSLCLDLIYDRGAAIPDDERWLAGICGVSVRRWRVIRRRLIDAGKLHDKSGSLSNDRAEFELENAAKTSRKLSENGSKGVRAKAEKRSEAQENNHLAEAGLKPTRAFQSPEPDIEGSEDKSSGASRAEPDFSKQAWDQALELLALAGMSEKPARAYFGKILSMNGLRAPDLLPAITSALVSRTPDGAAYLTKAAQGVARRRGSDDAPRIGFV